MAEVKKSMFRRLLPVILGIVLGLVIGAKSRDLLDRINGIIGGGSDDAPVACECADDCACDCGCHDGGECGCEACACGCGCGS